MRRGQLKGISSGAWVKEQGSTGEKLGSVKHHSCHRVCPPRDRIASATWVTSFGREIRGPCCRRQAPGFCSTLNCCWQCLADWRNSGCMFCADVIPICVLDRDCGWGHASGMGSSLLLGARDCSLAGRADCRHSLSPLHSWWDRQSRRLAA